VRDACDDERSTRGCEDRGEHADRRRLAGPVGAEDAEDLASIDGEREVFDGNEAAVLLSHAACFD